MPHALSWLILHFPVKKAIIRVTVSGKNVTGGWMGIIFLALRSSPIHQVTLWPPLPLGCALHFGGSPIVSLSSHSGASAGHCEVWGCDKIICVQSLSDWWRIDWSNHEYWSMTHQLVSKFHHLNFEIVFTVPTVFCILLLYCGNSLIHSLYPPFSWSLILVTCFDAFPWSSSLSFYFFSKRRVINFLFLLSFFFIISFILCLTLSLCAICDICFPPINDGRQNDTKVSDWAHPLEFSTKTFVEFSHLFDGITNALQISQLPYKRMELHSGIVRSRFMGSASVKLQYNGILLLL